MPTEKPQDVKEPGAGSLLGAHLKSYIEFERHWADLMAHFLTQFLGSIRFLNGTILFILGWVVINLGWIPGIHPFDPYPFNLLLMLVAFSAMLFAIVVLISENEQGRMADIRQRVDFEINVRAEDEITKMLTMLQELHARLGILKRDQELEKMKEDIDIAGIKEDIEQGIEKEEKMPRKP
jgi:uncharacterized membrane protein